MKKLEPSCIAGGKQNSTTTMENGLVILQKVKTESPYDPVFPFLGIYLKEVKILEKIPATLFTIMFFTAALSTVGKTWKQAKCPWMNEGPRNKYIQWDIFSHRNWGNPAIYDNMDGPWVHCAKWSKPDRERKILV